MSLWVKIKIYLKRSTIEQEVSRAYGMWLISPRATNSMTFVSNVTGLPREEVREILLGKKR